MPVWFLNPPFKGRRRHPMGIIIEVRAGEGGDDAKLLVSEQVAVYVKRCSRNGL